MQAKFKTLVLLTVLTVLLTIAIFPVVAQDAPYVPQWDGQSRFTVLILGMDRRPGARDTLRVRTDVIMVASIDPVNKTIGVLSIPRDMHFAPANSPTLLRVNTLLVEGENIQEGYGPSYAMETLQLNLGMYLDAYVAFDFEAFIMLVDAVGGVEIDVPYDIYDPTYPDMNYGYDPFFIKRGLQVLDGDLALKYARTRHADNDYIRGERQLQVLMGVRDRLMDTQALQALVRSAPTLLSEVEDNIYTDLPPDLMIMLGINAMTMPSENIHTGTLGADHSFDYATSEGVVRVPDREKLAELMIEIFGENYWQG